MSPKAQNPRGQALSFRKRLVFALLPAVALLGVAEIAVRVASLAQPALQSMPLPEESAGLLRQDPDLFWSLRPGASVHWKGQLANVNSLGLRGPEVAPKAPGELRILSLGESTTFGVGVADDATYSARLQGFLQRTHSAGPVTVLNAGVSAWSSFQSLKFLELRGLGLDPDMVLLYHEVNDYLPSTLRDASNTEIGLMKTDRQLYEARTNRAHRALMQASALYRFAAYRLAHRRIQKFDAQGFENPLLTIGLPDISIQPRLAEGGDMAKPVSDPNQNALGVRVSPEERLEILQRFVDLTAERDITLIVIHPSYRDSGPHDCVLTRFCRDHRVPMVEAYRSLHPHGAAPGARYLDSMHPNAEGHRQLAWDLSAAVNAMP